ncbi:hypothetical protein BH09ACT1_BH09ACT1_07320 [soil metagenome]
MSSRTRPRITRSSLATALGAVALLAALSVVGAAAASASGVRSPDLGAATGPVSVHASGLAITWSPAFTGGKWILDGIAVAAASGEPFTSGERVRLSLIGANGAALCEVVAVHSGASSSVISVGRSTVASACGSVGLSFGSISRVALVSMR